MEFFLSNLPKDFPCLLLWSNSCLDQQTQIETVTQLRSHLKHPNLLLLDHIDRLILVQHTHSSYNTVIIGVIPPHVNKIGFDLLAEIARVLKPSGKLVIKQVVVKGSGIVQDLMGEEMLLSQLKLAGLIDPICTVKDMKQNEKLSAMEGASKIQIAIGDRTDQLQYIEVTYNFRKIENIFQKICGSQKIVCRFESIVKHPDSLLDKFGGESHQKSTMNHQIAKKGSIHS